MHSQLLFMLRLETRHSTILIVDSLNCQAQVQLVTSIMAALHLGVPVEDPTYCGCWLSDM